MWTQKQRGLAIALALLSTGVVIIIYLLQIQALESYDIRFLTFSKSAFGKLFQGPELAIQADLPRSSGFRHLSDTSVLINIAIFFALGLSSFILFAKLRPLLALPLVFAICASYTAIAAYIDNNGLRLGTFYPFAAIVLASVMAAVLRKAIYDERATEISSILSCCLPENSIHQISKDPSLIKTAGEKKQATVLFSDINELTIYSEKQHPAFVIKFLNQYLTAMARVILKHDGTVNKFLSDGLMACWGAPLSREKHAEHAVRCALAMSQMLEHMKNKWSKAGVPPLSFRVGINTGEVVSGNIGVPGKKMEYTVMGGNVTFASRLLAAANFFGVTVLVGENTYRLTMGLFIYRELDYIRMANREKPVRIYELLGPNYDRERDIFESRAKKFARALNFYRNSSWPEALAAFEMIANKRPDDQPARIFIKRCEFLIKNPPTATWDGVFDEDVLL